MAAGHAPALPKFATIPKHEEFDAAPVLRAIVDADLGGEPLGLTVQLDPELAGGVGADTVLEMLSDDGERLSQNAPVGLGNAPTDRPLLEVEPEGGGTLSGSESPAATRAAFAAFNQPTRSIMYCITFPHVHIVVDRIDAFLFTLHVCDKRAHEKGKCDERQQMAR